jgi:hypothetical protein
MKALQKKERQRRRQRPEQPTRARSLSILDRGISSPADFYDLMTALMRDVAHGAITPRLSNSICNAAGKRLRLLVVS